MLCVFQLIRLQIACNINKAHGITEEQLSANRKHVCFFAYNFRMERGTVLIQTWLSAQSRKENLAKNAETSAQTQAPLGEKVHDPRANPGAPD